MSARPGVEVKAVLLSSIPSLLPPSRHRRGPCQTLLRLLLLLLLLLLSSREVVIATSHSSRSTPSTCAPRHHTTLSRIVDLPLLPTSFFPSTSKSHGHGHLEHNIPCGDAGFADYGTDLFNLPVFGEKGPHPVFADVYGHPNSMPVDPMYSNPYLLLPIYSV